MYIQDIHCTLYWYIHYYKLTVLVSDVWQRSIEMRQIVSHLKQFNIVFTYKAFFAFFFAEAPCSEGEFSCSDGVCINTEWECDGYADCSDRGDELFCCPDSQFNCANGRCIELSQVCDENDDCRDNSDETQCRGNCYVILVLCRYTAVWRFSGKLSGQLLDLVPLCVKQIRLSR